MAEPYTYTGSKAGAIASGFFVTGCCFVVCYVVAGTFIVAPEGRPDDFKHVGLLFYIVLAVGALFSAMLGRQTKRFFDRTAGRG